MVSIKLFSNLAAVAICVATVNAGAFPAIGDGEANAIIGSWLKNQLGGHCASHQCSVNTLNCIVNCNKFRSECCQRAEGPMACICQRSIGSNCATSLDSMYAQNSVCAAAMDKCAAEGTCNK